MFFISVLNNDDIIQLEHSKRAVNIHTIKILTSYHGIAIPLDALSVVLNMDKDKLVKIERVDSYTSSQFIWEVLSLEKRIFYFLKLIKRSLFYRISELIKCIK